MFGSLWLKELFGIKFYVSCTLKKSYFQSSPFLKMLQANLIKKQQKKYGKFTDFGYTLF